MGAIAAPIMQGKVETWKKWATELKGTRKQEFQDFNKRMGLTSHRAWLQANPDGSHLVIILHEGPGAGEFMAKLATSDHAFDQWFRENVSDAHGIDFSQPPPGSPAELLVEG